MWKFWRTVTVIPLPESLRLRLAKERGVGDQTAAALRMMQEPGRYSGRKVTYFQVFDPATTQAPSTGLRRFADLEARQVLHSGHIENDGRIVLHLRTAESEPGAR